MLLICPTCSTSYQIADNALGDQGRKVKCHKCGNVWTAKPAISGQDGPAARKSPPASGPVSATAGAGGGDEKTVDASATEIFDAGGDGADGYEDAAGGADAGVESVDVTVSDDPELQALKDVLRGTSLEEGVGKDVESAAKRKGKRARKGRSRQRGRIAAAMSDRPARMVAIAAILAVCAGGLFYFRSGVVGIAPGTAQLYAALGQPVNLQGLEIHNVGYETAVEDGLSVLSVRGEVVNVSDQTIAIPEIGYTLRDNKLQELYYWTGKATRREIAPAERVTFVTRLAAPPLGAEHVEIRFVRNKPKNDGRS